MEYTVGELARLSRVSVRTLHHYDAIGLLTPSGRSPGGYRLYSEADLRRLRQILLYRELEFGLDAIARVLADPQAGADDHLRRQHRLVRQRQDHLAALLRALEKEMEARQMGISLTPDEQFEIFGTASAGTDYADEAKRRWGDTPAWTGSRRRTAAYGKEDWLAIKAQADANLAAFARAMRAALPAAGTVAMDLAEEHRRHISHWFCDCSHAMHRRLAAMYVADVRFAASFDTVQSGLAQYLHDAMCANADRATGACGVTPDM